MNDVFSLPVVDASRLDEERRSALRPGALVPDDTGALRQLPRFFYEVVSWQIARETELAPDFALWEFLEVDLHEAPAVRAFPRYVPCAVVLLATVLSLLRQHVNQPIRISANGGYRSPAHARSRPGSPHCWGTAVNVYRVGDEWLDTEPAIERLAAVATRVAPTLWARPFGHGAGCCDDHLHLDLGFATFVPRHAPGV
jgi:hypothetical protein